MNDSIQIATKERSLRHYLLDEKDYLIIRSDNEKYLFLANSLKYFRIANPAVEEYLRLSRTKDLHETSLSEEEIETIGSYLRETEPEEEEKTIDTHPNFLILNVTSGCNLACKYCFANTVQGRSAMSFDTARQAIDNMLGQSPEEEAYSIYFFGGEPLLKTNLVRKITEYAYSEIEERREKKIRFLLNTNATLIDEEAIALFKEFDFKVTVSIDGPMAIHDAGRVDHKGKGSFLRVMEGVRALKELRIETNLRATFTPQTENLTEVFSFFEDQQLPYAYSFTLPVDYQGSQSDTRFRREQFKAIDRQLKGVMDLFYEKIIAGEAVYATGLMTDLATIRYKNKRSHGCEAGRKSITVDEQGNYFGCQNMIPYKETIIGTLETGVIEKRREKIRSKELRNIPACRQCPVRNLCAGGCEIERFDPAFSGNGQMCRLTRLEWENKLYLYARIIGIKSAAKKR